MPPVGKKWGKNPPRRPSRRRSTSHPRRARADAPRVLGDATHGYPSRDAMWVEEYVAEIRRRAGNPPGYREIFAVYASTSSDLEGWLTFFEGQYAETKNPVFAFEALALSLRSGEPLPEWLRLFWIDVTARLALLSRSDIPTGNKIPHAVYRALGFGDLRRGVHPFRALSDLAHDAEIAGEVWQQIRDGKKAEFAFIDVAREHPTRCERMPQCSTLSASTVRRLWMTHGRPPTVN